MKKKLLKSFRRMLSGILKAFLVNLPYIRKYKDYLTGCPPGHYYNPIPSKKDIVNRADQIYKNIYKRELLGIELNIAEQLKLLEKFNDYYSSFPFKFNKEISFRYY